MVASTIFFLANKVKVCMYYYANSLILSVILLLNKCILTYFIGYRVEVPIIYQLRAYALDVDQ